VPSCHWNGAQANGAGPRSPKPGSQGSPWPRSYTAPFVREGALSVPDLAGETLDPVKDGPVDHKGGTDAAVLVQQDRVRHFLSRAFCVPRPPIRPAPRCAHRSRALSLIGAQPFADVHVPPTEVGREHQNAGHGIDQCRHAHSDRTGDATLFTECFENRRPAASCHRREHRLRRFMRRGSRLRPGRPRCLWHQQGPLW